MELWPLYLCTVLRHKRCHSIGPVLKITKVHAFNTLLFATSFKNALIAELPFLLHEIIKTASYAVFSTVCPRTTLKEDYKQFCYRPPKCTNLIKLVLILEYCKTGITQILAPAPASECCSLLELSMVSFLRMQSVFL
jgi:hypothetical protein